MSANRGSPSCAAEGQKPLVKMARSGEEDLGNLELARGGRGWWFVYQKVPVLGACCTVLVSTCLRGSNTSCQVQNNTSP